ncbi:efflux RND transporter permease subunit, partial [Vibrio parahaemolyticus]
SLIALTLTPVLGSKLLKANVKPGRFNQLIDRLFARLESGYRQVVSRAIRWRWAAPVVIAACIGGSYGLMQLVPAQLTP